MIKRVAIPIIVVLLLILIAPGVTQAQDGLMVLDSTAEVDFPTAIIFKLQAESDIDITDVRLHYRVDRVNFALVTSEVWPEFTPGQKVEASWTWDARKVGGLPPGTEVEYWWTIGNAAEVEVESSPKMVCFDDLRYPWQSLTSGQVTLLWYDGDSSFAQELMADARQALARLAEDTGAYPTRPVRIYIYASTDDLHGAMIYPQEWTGGVAFTMYSTIVIGIPVGELSWGKRAVAHELTHLVIHQVTLSPYGGIPAWLDEGLAMYAEGELEPHYQSMLYGAVSEGRLISVRSLSSPFSAYAGEARLSYAQSYSLVEFLIDEFGQDRMLKLLNAFGQGSGYDEALSRVYGFDMDGLDTLWQESISAGVSPAGTVALHPALITVLAALATLLLLGAGVAIRRRIRSQDGEVDKNGGM